MEVTAINRKSNLELLRILAMFLIILIHLMSAIDESLLGLTGNYGRILGGMIVGICNMGPACFCLISGYFGMKFSMQKLLKMELMMIMFSLLELFVLCIVFPQDMRGAAFAEQLLKSLFPFVSRKYWFYSCYVCLYLFSGFIEKLIRALNEKELKRLVLLMIVVFSVFPTIFYFEIMQDAGKGLMHMFMLYMIGRYIKLFRDVKVNRWKAILIFMILWAMNTVSIMNPIRVGEMVHSLCRDNSITNVAMAIILLYLFKDIDISSKWVNHFTANMFAVFALENTLAGVFAALVARGGLIVNNEMLGTILLLGITGFILILCAIVGKIRETLFGKLEKRLIVAMEKGFEGMIRRVRL